LSIIEESTLLTHHSGWRGRADPECPARSDDPGGAGPRGDFAAERHGLPGIIAVALLVYKVVSLAIGIHPAQ
jgi:hypothetical protein